MRSKKSFLTNPKNKQYFIDLLNLGPTQKEQVDGITQQEMLTIIFCSWYVLAVMERLEILVANDANKLIQLLCNFLPEYQILNLTWNVQYDSIKTTLYYRSSYIPFQHIRPTTDSTTFHGHRVYHEVQAWGEDETYVNFNPLIREFQMDLLRLQNGDICASQWITPIQSLTK